MGTIINSAGFLSSRSSSGEDKAAPSDKKININGAGSTVIRNHRININGSLTSSLLIISLMIFTMFFLFIFLNSNSDLLMNTNYLLKTSSSFSSSSTSRLIELQKHEILIRNISTNINDHRAEEQQPIRIIEMNSTSAGSNRIKIKREKRKKGKIPFGFGLAAGKKRRGGGGGGEYCDVFSGKWVLDNSSSYPLYREESCSFNDEGFMCKTYGRPDSEFRRWRWQPHHCDLPRFNATFMLEALRGKRMLFVGDSLNRNQFVSMACLLQSVVPDHFKSFKVNGSLSTFYAENYNATVEFYWAPLLFESNCDDPGFHRLEERIVRFNSIEKHAQHWKGAEIIVFNSYIWWVTGQKMKMLRGSFDDKTQNIMELDTDDAYRIGLEGMAHWVEENMDPLRTRVFFTSMSPYHMWSKEWGTEEEGNCYNQTSPIDDPNYWGSGLSKSMMNVTADVLRKTKVPIVFLNISQLSLYRKDAHSSIYRKHWTPLTPNELANPRSYADCIHWCVPGVPDTWNELLYAKLFYP